MIPYFALLFVPLLLQGLLQLQDKQIRVGKRIIIAEKVVLPTFFLLFIILLAVRDETIGRDLSNYKYMFSSWGKQSLSNILSQPEEVLFYLYCWFIYNYVSNNYQIFLAITALLTVAPIAYVYNKDKSHGYLKTVVFINMSTFVMLFSGIRQSLAMAAGILAYSALKDKKWKSFCVWALIAMFFHHSGFMVWLLFPLCTMRFKQKDLLWIVPCGALVVVLNRQIFNVLSAFFGDESDKYGYLAESTGAIGTFLLFLLFSVFCYVIADETKMDDEAFALRNILTFATVIQSFASLNPLAMRMNYYFILLIPLALGMSVKYAKPRFKQVAKIGEMVICFYFTLIFVYSTYRSFVTGISSLDTIPYIPFWQE